MSFWQSLVYVFFGVRRKKPLAEVIPFPLHFVSKAYQRDR